MTLAEQLFRYVDVRLRTPEEQLYRLVDSILEDTDASLDRITWDWYDNSVEIYLDTNDIPEQVDLTKLWDAGFSIVWIHPFRCTKNGHRDHENCKCLGRRKKLREP